jgi:hypothetical protein
VHRLHRRDLALPQFPSRLRLSADFVDAFRDDGVGNVGRHADVTASSVFIVDRVKDVRIPRPLMPVR